MGNLFSSFAKIISILLMLLYSYGLFRNLSIDYREGKKKLSGLLYKILLLLHFISYAVLYFQTGNLFYIYFYLPQLLYFLLYPLIWKKLYPFYNEVLLNNQCLFLALGWILLARLQEAKAIKQFAVAMAASLLVLVIPYIVDKIWDFQKFRYIFAGIGIVSLLLVLVLGTVNFGAKMSVSLFGFRFQASEFVKLSFVFSIAGILSEEHGKEGVIHSACVAALHGIILVLCKDLGSALLLFISYVFMLYVARNQLLYLLAGGLVSALAGIVSYGLFSHVRTRVYAFIDPWRDMAGKGYQITQSLFAIGTGGFLGLGLFQGLPNKIPIVENDFIFSALSEEMGGVVAICLILICLSCFMQMMMMGRDMESSFYKLVALGLSVIYVIQVILTIGGAIKFVPSTGVTLPFMSYGGSSLISSFIVFALFQSLFIIQGQEVGGRRCGEKIAKRKKAEKGKRRIRRTRSISKERNRRKEDNKRREDGRKLFPKPNLP